MTEVTYNQKKKLEHDIKNLEHNEYNEILNILKKNDQTFSENSRGIYFNLKYIENKVILEIIDFIEFSKKNKGILKNQEKNSNLVSAPINNNEYTKNNDIWDIDKVKEEFSQINKKNNSNEFIFKNYLDKISIVPNKEFKEKKMIFPDIIETNSNFTGTHDRLLRKCKNNDINIVNFNSDNSILMEDNL